MEPIHFLNLEYILLWIYDFVKNFDPVRLLNLLIQILAFLQPFAILLSLIFLSVLIYARIRMRQIGRIEAAEDALAGEKVVEEVLNEKWQKIEEHSNSTNPNDWRMAIIEADIMLDDVLSSNGYRGDSIGDKLKQVNPDDMLTLNDAWDAHKVRNLIAHAGSDYKLNEREVKRVVGLYKNVFVEFKHI
jgi:hypothetical protein